MQYDTNASRTRAPPPSEPVMEPPTKRTREGEVIVASQNGKKSSTDVKFGLFLAPAKPPLIRRKKTDGYLEKEHFEKELLPIK
eukprot:CAMPEP_0197515098 /NCGR_PEP_ID=MMETSP1318-20131121/334_1 /TAXON_ID=552666 /ORGANISM="Partenskyella glossopodia, Strain RCC365" /LENGTH=82 /DNA_ID=CAMNT_0043063375 /DNA_START=40 /DNA_END=288 /DNA_ORIENTATION=-